MNSTPFQLLEKAASNAQQTNPYSTNLQSPFATAQQPAEEPGFGWKDGALLAADFGLGSIPVVGTIWNGGRAVWDAAHGNWGGAATNAALAGLGLVGLGGVGAGIRAAGTGAKLATNAGRLAKLQNVAAKGIAAAGARGGAIGGAARGLMSAGEKATALSQRAPLLYHTATFGAPMLAGKMLPDNSGAAAVPAAQPQRQYTGSVPDVMADIMSNGGHTMPVR